MRLMVLVVVPNFSASRSWVSPRASRTDRTSSAKVAPRFTVSGSFRSVLGEHVPPNAVGVEHGDRPNVAKARRDEDATRLGDLRAVIMRRRDGDGAHAVALQQQ